MARTPHMTVLRFTQGTTEDPAQFGTAPAAGDAFGQFNSFDAPAAGAGGEAFLTTGAGAAQDDFSFDTGGFESRMVNTGGDSSMIQRISQ